MKTLQTVVLKDGSILYVNRKVTNTTYFDLQTKGKYARQNILRLLRHEYIDYKEVEILQFEDISIEMY